MKYASFLYISTVCCLTCSCQSQSHHTEEPSQTSITSYEGFDDDEEGNNEIHLPRPQVVQISHE